MVLVDERRLAKAVEKVAEGEGAVAKRRVFTPGFDRDRGHNCRGGASELAPVEL
jgi:hypothetical protein